jgi:hypothetical protein
MNGHAGTGGGYAGTGAGHAGAGGGYAGTAAGYAGAGMGASGADAVAEPAFPPPGTSIPVDGWLHQDIQQRLRDTKKHARQVAERQAFIAQRFGAWQVYPVKVGRWRLKLYGLVDPGDGWGDDPISMILFVLYLAYLMIWFVGWVLLGFGRWTQARDVVQVLDPVTGRPIAEVVITAGAGDVAGLLSDIAAAGTLTLLGDPRVCGLVGQPTSRGTVELRGTAYRRGSGWGVREKHWTAQALPATAQRLIATPYRQYPTRRCGPWLVDSPEPPRGGRTRWTRLRRPKD